LVIPRVVEKKKIGKRTINGWRRSEYGFRTHESPVGAKSFLGREWGRGGMGVRAKEG